MSNEIAKPYMLSPTNFQEAEKFSIMIASSSLCPTPFKNKPGDIMVAMQMGAEVGLNPMQAIQNIAVINGRPCLYGDAAIGVVRCHKHCEWIDEGDIGSIKDGTAVYHCTIKRKGQDPQTRSFSVDKAKKAGLWGKSGPWSQYPERMLQMRARGFALRDVFPDALRGLNIAEEIEDITLPEDSKKNIKTINEQINEVSYNSPESGNIQISEDNLLTIEQHVEKFDIIESKIEKALKYFNSLGMKEQDIFDHFEINGREDMNETHLEELRQISKRIKEDHKSFEEALSYNQTTGEVK